MRTALPVLLFASLISLSVLAEDEGHMRPFKREMLLKPIEISECSMKILEWRPKKNDKQTKPNQKNIDIVRKTCKLAVDKFPEFVTQKGYKVKQTDYKINISFMPYNKEHRNLNDIEDRFKYRTKFLNSEGKPYSVYGYTERSDDYIYMRNDPVKDGEESIMFKTVLGHEISHFLSFNLGIYYQLADNTYERMIKDEKLAEDFTEYIGLNR